jgi:hypothetical protein
MVLIMLMGRIYVNDRRMILKLGVLECRRVPRLIRDGLVVSPGVNGDWACTYGQWILGGGRKET